MNCRENYVDLLEGMFLRANCKQEKWICRQFQPLSKILVLLTLVWKKINPIWQVEGILIMRKHLETRATNKPRLEKAGKNPSLPKFQFMKFQKWHAIRLFNGVQLTPPFFALFMSKTERIVWWKVFMCWDWIGGFIVTSLFTFSLISIRVNPWKM